MILSRNKLRKFEKSAQRPPLFEKSERNFWTDPYVSKHILNAHLDPTTNDASRTHETVKESAGWIAGKTGGGRGRRLLDLGCGPGLYCSEFYRLGFEVTGIDFSESSISHAKQSAKGSGEIITYLRDDFLATELPGGFDVVTMIYGAFCVLSNDERDLLLWKLRSVLRPGGLFVLDVFTNSYGEGHRLKTDWYLRSSDGFWSAEPHLVLEQSFEYPEADTYLNQYFVLTAGSEIKKFHIWHHHYSRDTIVAVLEDHKMSVVEVSGDLIGTPYDAYGEWIGLICRKMK